jgi:glycosyltransferase involved in cell wall biosynthesis
MPHGMLDPHSLGRKWLKKQLYGRAIEWPNLRAASAMIYTHDDERQLAESAVARLPRGHVVTLGADAPPDAPRAELAEEFLARYPQLRGRRRAIFLSRLHPKKGLDLLIPAWAEVVRRQPDAHLVLVGPADEAYAAQLRRWVGENGLDQQVTFTGPLHGRAKWAALAAGELFLLPSYQENFALVVTEALRTGLPVVLSQRVNIWREVTASGSGLDCELSPGSIANCVLKFLGDEKLRASASAAGQRLADEHFTWERSVEALERVYEEVLREPRPTARSARASANCP